MAMRTGLRRYVTGRPTGHAAGHVGRGPGVRTTRRATGSLGTLAVAAIVGTLSSCSTSAPRTDGYPTGTFQRTVDVWLDADGPFTCPPEGPVASSDPPRCASPDDDRVRLENKPIWTFVAATGLSPSDGAPQYVGVAKVSGRASNQGFTIETEHVRTG